ncbi:hypothetical protein CDL12_20011 [Handroanthus impetiginosus]|uniref:Uncharacterized protein n=1 Tax=Handroanthus impetiginosus TaxID=429701 RepID=A0A2G9GQ45_9LAMI|nr:hypothetical protein CDL12_20011 [Handroanthus impetiginosus]
MGGHLLSLHSSSQASRIKRLTAYLLFSTRRSYSYKGQGKKESGSGHAGIEERAPSTADEFKRVAEEKSRQGFTSHTVEKGQDAAEEATLEESTFESVKEAHKEPPGKGNFHKTGDER